MDKKKISVKNGEYEIIDGRVVITSDELAMAINEQQLELAAEEEAEGLEFNINLGNCGCK